MVREQILKRASYIGAALMLMLAAVPIIPVSAAPADHCATRAYGRWLLDDDNLYSYLNNNGEASLCANISSQLGIGVSRSAVLDLNGHTYNGNLTSFRGSITILGDENGKIDGDLNAWGGSFTIYGGTYTSNPTQYVADGYYAKPVGRTWVVMPEKKVVANDVVIPVNGVTDFYTVTPAGASTYVVSNAAGATVSDALRVNVAEENGVTKGTVTGLVAGEYNVALRTETNDTANASVKVFDYTPVSDMVLPKGANQNIGLTTTGADVAWEVIESSNPAVATVENGKVNALASGKTTMKVRFADTLGTTFTFDVYVYDFDAEDNLPLLIKKGSSAVVSTDSYWNVTASPDNSVASTVKGGEGKFTVNGLSVGETEFTFSSTVNGTPLSKKIKVYVYDVEKDEIWVEKGQTINYDGTKLGSNDVTVEVVSGDAEIANAATTVYDIEGKSAGDVTLTYKLKVSTRIVEIPVTVHVYSVNAKTSATIVEGTEVDFTNAAIATIENPGAVTVKIKEGSEYISADTTANGKLTTNAKGTAVIEFYAGETKVGETEIKVYALQDLRDIVLSITGTGANLSEVVNKLDDVNLPEYRINIADNSVASVRDENEWSWRDWAWHTTGHRISARGAGKTTATVTYTDSLGETTQTFDVLVSDYATRNVRGTHDVAQGSEVEFMISELYDQNSVSYEDDLGFEISHDERGEYIVRVPADMAGGEYTLKFTDKVGDVEIAKQDVVIRVHEITASQDELYIKKDGEAGEVTVNEANGFASICENVWHGFLWWGHYEYECNIEITDTSGAASDGITVNATEGSDEYKIVVNEAGEYKVTFSDGVASKTITVYAIDFTVDKTEYHLVKGDNAPKLVKAINKYWNETNADTVNGFEVTKKVNSETDYYFWPTDAEAGNYTLTFYAKIGDKIVDEKTVDIYIYEMIKPVRHSYYGATGTAFNVEVGDKNPAAHTETSVDGPAGGLVIMGNRVVALRPGVYTVTYTDYMADGGKVGEYVATFTVFNVEREVVTVARGESVELTPHTDWSTDKATDRTSGRDLSIENENAMFVTDEDTELGVHNVVLGHDFGRGKREVVKEVAVVVYSVEADAETDPEGVTADTLEEYIENMFNGSSSWEEFVEKMQKAQELFGEGFDAFWSVANVSGAVFGGDEINTRVEVTALEEDEVDEALIETIEGLDVDNVEYFDVSVWMSRNGYDFGKMHQLNGKITVALAEVTDPETGYSRQYIVVRQHEGEEPEVLVEGVDFYVKDGVLYVISDKFSTFAVAYKDTLMPARGEVVYTVTAPNTGESTANEGGASASLSVMAIAAIAAVTLVGAAVFAKRK